jgi:hypothetical protein
MHRQMDFANNAYGRQLGRGKGSGRAAVYRLRAKITAFIDGGLACTRSPGDFPERSDFNGPFINESRCGWGS